MQIQKVVSPKGIEAWLVEDHTLPLIAMQLGFEGGSAQDPAGKDGLAYFASGMLDEGAGDIDSQAFQEKLEGLAIELSFDASRDAMTGGLKTLTKNKEEAFRLLAPGADRAAHGPGRHRTHPRADLLDHQDGE